VVLGYNANPQDLKRRFEVREFAVANMQAMSGDPGVKPVYRPVETGKGECWLIPVGGGVSCAVPLPRPTYNLGWFQAARMDRVFSYKGSTEGYRKAEVVKPAIFRETGQDGMVELVEQGILELREAEEEKEPPAAATPEPAAPPDEATAIAVRYQANTERLYSALDGVRVSVANIDALNQNPTAAPVFVPNTFGAFWVVGGRFLVPRPASLDNLSEMRPAPTKFFDCTADGAGEAPQKNVLVRAASLRTADAGWALEDRGAIRLASGENDWQGAIEEIVRLYRSGAEGLRKRYNVVPFGVTNASELEANRSANPKFGPLAEGRYWLLEGGARPCYAVPAPGLAIDDRLIRSAGFLALFGVAGYQTGRTYRRIELVRPAGLDSWRVVVSGEIKLGPAEGDPEPETAPAPAPASQPAEPQKAETPDEPRPLVGVKAVHAKMAELFNQDPGAFRERFSPTRFGVTNLGKFRSQPKADPAFGPKRNGDYWLVATGPYANSRYACVVPYPGIEVDAETFRHLRKVFNCMGYQAGRRYSGVRLVLPAVVKEMPAEGWNIVKTGIIELTKGEPDVDVD
jgi:hypothetical protein